MEGLRHDPVKHGEQLAEAVCAFLAGHRIRKGMGVIAPEYIVGESFPRGWRLVCERRGRGATL